MEIWLAPSASRELLGKSFSPPYVSDASHARGRVSKELFPSRENYPRTLIKTSVTTRGKEKRTGWIRKGQSKRKTENRKPKNKKRIMSSSTDPSRARQRNRPTSSHPPGSGSDSGSDSASNGEALKPSVHPSTTNRRRKKDDSDSPQGNAGLTVLKAFAGLAVLVPALSYLIMDGESFTFGYNPRWVKWEYWVRGFTLL